MGPLLLLPLSFADTSRSASVVRDLLPEALQRSLVLAAGVAIGTLLLGTGLAVLLTFYDFPLRRWLEWGVVVPLAMPGYVLTFVLLGQYESDGPVLRLLRTFAGDQARLPDLRSTWGAILVLTLVLYPYVYLLARASFVGQSRGLLEAARSLGLAHGAAIRRVALPLARPAIAGGVAIAVMEALADFGTVNLLNYRALTDAIYRVWYGAFDRRAALQLGAVLLGLVLVLVAIERASRRRRSVEQGGGRGDEVDRVRLHGLRALLATSAPLLLLLVVFVAPVAQLVAWSVDAVGAGTFDERLVTQARNSILLATLASLLVLAGAVVLTYAERLRGSLVRRSAARMAGLGYAVPGSVAAAAVFLVLDGVGDAVGFVLTGSLLALLIAYVVRFTALPLKVLEARLASVPAAVDTAARSLGAGTMRLFGEVHLPLLQPALATGMLLVFVEVLKELPATVLLRPFGLDTLAVAVWEATKESLYQTAAFPALCIVAVGTLPVALLVRATDRRSAAPPSG